LAGYYYIAVDPEGKQRKGRMEAPDEERVFNILKADGLFPVIIKDQGFLSRDIKLDLSSPVKSRDLSVFARQFGSIIRAGVPIVKALMMMAEQTENKTLRKAIINAELMVERGEPLSDAMRTQGKVFTPFMINMIEAGEVSGNLEKVFERIAVHYEKETRLRSQIKKAMIYPAMLGVISLGVVIFMLVFVIPSFMKMFEDMEIEMPAITVAILKLSNFIRQEWLLLVIVLVGLIFSFLAFKNSQTGRKYLDSMALKAPIFGKLNVKTTCARFTRILSTLISSGISLIDAIELTARTIDNVVIKKALITAKEEVIRGIPLSAPLLASGLFPPMVHHMIRIGEDTGSMESMLDKIADYYDEEVELTTASLTAALDPIIIIVMALIICVMLIAMLQPMFAMYEQMGTLTG
jgi:type IV pilus assembly protein PilC